MSNLDTIAWQKWNSAGYSLQPSKIHYTYDDKVTFCGRRVPEGNGYEVGSGYDIAHEFCSRCQRSEAIHNGR